MSLTRRSALLAPLFAALAAASCDKVPLMAPTNSTIRLISSIGVLPLSGTAEITAVVIESAGTPVQNGTVVTFTSSLGTFEPREARTQNGQVMVRFLAGGQSGKASISAFSGGTKSEALEILVGASAAGGVTLRADRTTVPTTGGTVAIVANVVDTTGNPLRNTPVTFVSTAGSLSRSSAVTNETGDATTELFTNVEATVSAVVGGGATPVRGELRILARDLPVVAIAIVGSLGPNTTEAGLATIFSLRQENAAGSSAIRSAVIDFGDGSPSRQLGALTGTAISITHQYTRRGFYTVTVTATDALGQLGVSTLAVQVTDRFAISVTVTSSVAAGVATLSATATPRAGTSIVYYEWDFGDRSPLSYTTGPLTTHRYTAVGTYRVRLRVVATNGDEGYWEGDVRVNAI